MAFALLPGAARAETSTTAAITASAGCPDGPGCLATTFADILTSAAAEVRAEAIVAFQPGRVRVYSAGRERIAQLARAWQAQPRWSTITVEGYASGRGRAEALALARQRAERVRGYLVRYGVAPEHIVVVARLAGGDGRVDVTIARCARGATCRAR